jgi:hypothetical protein
VHLAARDQAEVQGQHPWAARRLATAAWGASDDVHRDVLSAGSLSVRQGEGAERLVVRGPGAQAWVEAQRDETLLLRQQKAMAHF